MKDRLIPAILGLGAALLFSLSPSIILSHVMYLGAAWLLYREIIYMSSFSPREKSSQRALLITGFFSLFIYALAHTLLLRTTPSTQISHYSLLGLTTSRYEIDSAFIFLYSLLFFLIPNYLISIFIQKKPKSVKLDSGAPAPESASVETPFTKRFQNLLMGLHALFYSTFFLYSIVKVKYSYLYIPHASLTEKSSIVLLLFIWILIWLYDSAAYLGGTSWGKRKLGLKVSPQKSWAGLYVGTLTLNVLLVLFKLFGIKLLSKELENVWFFQSFGYLLILNLFVVFTAQLGDLIASFFKRSVLIKDSGTLFGAHGGFLDRNDSAILTFTLFYHLLLFTL